MPDTTRTENHYELALALDERVHMIIDSNNTTNYREKYRLMWWSSYTTPADSALIGRTKG
jgi:hypothetical protein